MKKLKTVFIPLLLLLGSCGENSSENDANSLLESEMNGPDLEINVISFSHENNKTEIEVINRLDVDVKNISGRLVFLDEKNLPLTTATGRQKDSPFQKEQNPCIVKAKSKTRFTLSNRLDEKISSIRIEEVSWKTVGK
jgi:hypothetical protein